MALAVIIAVRVPIAPPIVVAVVAMSDVNDYAVVTMTMMFSLVVIASLNRAWS
jgi:hypothetical protein